MIKKSSFTISTNKLNRKLKFSPSFHKSNNNEELQKMIILGIHSAFNAMSHDPSAALMINGKSFLH